MTNDETSRPNIDLTDPTGMQESDKGSTEPHGEVDGELTEESKAGFQKAIQKSQENLKIAKSELATLQKKVDSYEKEKKQASLAEMSEIDRLKAQLVEAEKRNAKLKINLLADNLLKGKNVPAGIARIVRETPWALPDIANELSDDASWEDVSNLVEEKLPDIIDTLVVGAENPTPEEQSRRVDPERSSVTATEVQKSRKYTMAEIKQIASNPEMWAKHEKAIMRQLEQDNSAVI